MSVYFLGRRAGALPRLLLASTALLAPQALSGLARAAEDCGAPAGNVVICNAGTATDSFLDEDGISYLDPATATNLTLTHDAGSTAQFIRIGHPTNPPSQSFGNLAIFNHGRIDQTNAVSPLATAGIFALTDNGTVSITNDAAIDTETDTAEGIFASARGEARVINSGTIATDGNRAEGIDVSTVNGLAWITNSAAISTQGADSWGIAGGSFNSNVLIEALAGSDIDTAGRDARGIDALSVNGAVEIRAAGTVDTLGDLSHGIQARVFAGAGRAVVSGSANVTVEGAGAHALNVETVAGLIDIDVTGRYAAGVGAGNALRAVSTSGAIDIVALGGLTSAGAGQAALLATGTDLLGVTLGGQVRGNGANAVAVSLTGEDVDLLLEGTAQVHGSIDAVTVASTLAASLTFFQNASIDAGNDVALRVTSDAGSTSVSGAAITGRMILTGGVDSFTNRGDFNLQDRFNAEAVNDFGGGGDLFVNDSGGRVRLMSIDAGGDVGVFADLETFRNAGLLTLADLQTGGGAPAANDVVRIEGNYQSAGGFLSLDTVLGDETSASDLLRVTGGATTTTGATRVQVTNAGGAGAQTNGNGILVIEVAGASATDAFTLAGPVVAGAYAYDLVLQADGNWYLVSSLRDLLAVNPALGAYRVVPSMTLEGWYATLGSLDERLGELRHGLRDAGGQSAALGASDLQQAVRPGAGGRPLDGLWLRAMGQDLTLEDGIGLGFEQRTYALQAGYDMGWQGALQAGDLLLLGAFGGIDGGEGSTRSGGVATEFGLEGFHGGLYGSWLAEGGLYADAVAKLDWLSIDQSAGSGLAADYDALVAGLSLEVGYHLALGSGFYLEPEAQAAYARTWIGDVTDSTGAEASFDAADSLRGRLGLRAGRTWETGRGLLTPYLEASLVHEFLGDSAVTVSDLGLATTLENDLGGTRYELGFGIDASLASSGVSLYLDADYLGGEETQGVKLLGGLRVAW